MLAGSGNAAVLTTSAISRWLIGLTDVTVRPSALRNCTALAAGAVASADAITAITTKRLMPGRLEPGGQTDSGSYWDWSGVSSSLRDPPFPEMSSLIDWPDLVNCE